MKHTKGEWEIIKEGGGGSLRVVINREQPEKLSSICQLSGYSNDEEVKANAKLIAAAPDLLQATKYFIEWVEDVWGSTVLSEETKKEYELAKQAIKKAIYE